MLIKANQPVHPLVLLDLERYSAGEIITFLPHPSTLYMTQFCTEQINFDSQAIINRATCQADQSAGLEIVSVGCPVRLICAYTL